MPSTRQRTASPSDNSSGISARDRTLFRQRLLGWFRKNKRDMPWRRTRNPYRIWLSEIMLQQTRVAAVIPYYEQFLDRFSTVQRLARARLADVLSAWAGLGYYSRARNLHRAAQTIVAEHGGQFPRDANAALELPGIGRYTVAAILSIAYQEPLAALDGNVARVLARLGAIHGELREPKTWRRLDAAALELLEPRAPGDWNEAMMELGATVCTPVAPRCEQCPVARWCKARTLNLADELPEARRKKSPVKITIAAAVLVDSRGRTLLVRQSTSDAAIFSRLWQFPAVEGGNDPSAALAAHLDGIFGKMTGEETGKTPPNEMPWSATMRALPAARHTVTFRDVRLLPFLVPVRRLPLVAGARTPLLTALDRVAISGATRKIASAALRGMRQDPSLP